MFFDVEACEVALPCKFPNNMDTSGLVAYIPENYSASGTSGRMTSAPNPPAEPQQSGTGSSNGSRLVPAVSSRPASSTSWRRSGARPPPSRSRHLQQSSPLAPSHSSERTGTSSQSIALCVAASSQDDD